MKKFGLLTTLLVAGLLLTGCNKSVNVENEQERIFACGRSVSEYLGISDYSISWDKEEEAGASFVLNGRVNIGNGIDEEKITKNVQCVVDMVDKSVTIQEVSYDLDEYNQFLEDIKSSGEQPQGKKDNSEWDWIDSSEKRSPYVDHAKIVSKGNCSDYRNEEFGFHLNLPESWNDCMIIHWKTTNTTNNKVSYEAFKLAYNHGATENYSPFRDYYPDGWTSHIDIIVIGENTDVGDIFSFDDIEKETVANNKYRIGIGLDTQYLEDFEGRIPYENLACGLYPNCECTEKTEYDIGEIWDKIPNPYQNGACFLTAYLKDHIEVFDPAN